MSDSHSKQQEFGACPVFPEPTDTTSSCSFDSQSCCKEDSTTCDCDNCNLCGTLCMGDPVTLGTISGSIIIGIVTKKNFIHGCSTITIMAQEIAINGTAIPFPCGIHCVPVTICCCDINIVIKTILTLPE